MPRVIKTGRIDPITGQEEVEVAPPNNKKPQENTNENTNISDAPKFDIGDYNSKNNQAYYDATNSNKQTYTEAVANAQNEQTAKMNSGAGAKAALGRTYSWEAKGKELAENAYQQKVLEEKQGMLTQRQELEKNAQQYQTQADMQKYSDNQTADKVGWTGGYVLDQERQREYMKQSIQAQLYGAMELQKYGYDTAMAAARLSYDANLLNYSQEYYNQAVQNALNEAQVTGVYFSAEVKDMLSQYTVAEAKLKDSTLSKEEKARAQKVKDTIDNWFSGENNISKEGIKTLEAWNAEQALELQWSQELWTQYNAALQSIKEDINKQTTFIALDEKGNYIYDGNTIKTIDMTNMTDEDLAKYAENSAASKQQVESYISYLAEQIKNENSKKDEKTGEISYDRENLQKEYDALKEKIDTINKELSEENKINIDTSRLDALINNMTVKKNNAIKEGLGNTANLQDIQNYLLKTFGEDVSYREFKEKSPFSTNLTKEIYSFMLTHKKLDSGNIEYNTLLLKAQKELLMENN